jgi:hypothetical protein
MGPAGASNPAGIDIHRLTQEYNQLYDRLEELIDSDTVIETPAKLERYVTNIRKAIQLFEAKHNEIARAGTILSLRAHQSLIDEAMDVLESLESSGAVDMRTEAGEEYFSTTPSTMYSVEYDTLGMPGTSALRVKSIYPAGFFDPPRAWDASMASVITQLQATPLPKFSGDSGSVPWNVFWLQWKSRVHDLPVEALSIAVKYNKLVESLTGTARTITAGLDKLDIDSAYKLLVNRLHGTFYRIPMDPEKILKRLRTLEPKDHNSDSYNTWIAEVQAIALELVQAGRDSESAYRSCWDHLYAGLSEPVRGQLDLLLSKNPQTTQADKFNTCAHFLWVRLVRVKQKEETPSKKLLSFEQAEKSLLSGKKSNSGTGNPAHLNNNEDPNPEDFPSIKAYKKFMRKKIRKELSDGNEVQTALFAQGNTNNNKPKGKKSFKCPFHKGEAKDMKHNVDSCKLPLKFRIENVNAKKLCSVCLRNNHTTAACRTNTTCVQCDERHSEYLCPKAVKSGGGNNQNSRFPGKRGNKNKKKQANGKSNDSQDGGSKDGGGSEPSTSTNKSSGTDSRPTVTSGHKNNPAES